MADPTADDVIACMHEVQTAEALDGVSPGSSIGDLLDSFARVRLVPVLEDRLGLRLEQADLAPEHWLTVATLTARMREAARRRR